VLAEISYGRSSGNRHFAGSNTGAAEQQLDPRTLVELMMQGCCSSNSHHSSSNGSNKRAAL
jgi:hypothetical protein